MRAPIHDLEQFLEDLARNARTGERLPPIRELMRRFGVSQVSVQRAFQALRSRDLIASEVGRGTFFVAEGGTPGATDPSTRAPLEVRPAGAKSVLLLRRSASIARGRILIEGLQRRFAGEGHRVLEVSYTDVDHARTVLKGLHRFDACVVQSSFKPMAIDLLVALKERTDVVAVDGSALIGTDVDAVGTEWGEPLEAAITLLHQRGHRHIAFAVTSVPFLAVQLALRRLECLKQKLPDTQLELITLPRLPYEGYEDALAHELRELAGDAGRPPFTALVAWGIEDGMKFRHLLVAEGLVVPSGLSVVLLGRTDCVNEHADFFDTIGCAVSDQIELLYQSITTRWSDPSRPYGLYFVPITRREGSSIEAPHLEPPKRSSARRRVAAAR
jgi:hypothetical protein